MIHKTDFYKTGHIFQYPKGTEVVFSNWTARGSRMPDVTKVVFFGLQGYMLKVLKGKWGREFFSKPQDVVLDKYKKRISKAGFNITYDHVRALHNLGYLPLEVWALPEGTAVPLRVPMFVMWNTLPEFYWLTNYIETSMSANLWGPCTSATIAKEYRKVLAHAAKETGGDLGFVDYQGHDFSYRGMYGDEAAAMSGAAHLLSFKGTDCIPAIDYLENYYNGNPDDIGGSVPATEHSVMCMGEKLFEIDTFRRLITETYPTGPISIVSDTWDYWKVWTETLPKLRDEIVARDGKVIIRPDSGDPAKILCGDPNAAYDSPARKGSFQLAWEVFGGTNTYKGFKQLDSHIGLIYGDSITLERCKSITAILMYQGFVPSMVLGIGSFTYQYVTRDTFGFALKSTAGVVNGELREIFKDPVTDSGEKKSAKGLIAVDFDLKLHKVKSFNEVRSCAFIRVFKNGEVSARCNLKRIRELVQSEVV